LTFLYPAPLESSRMCRKIIPNDHLTTPVQSALAGTTFA